MQKPTNSRRNLKGHAEAWGTPEKGWQSRVGSGEGVAQLQMMVWGGMLK